MKFMRASLAATVALFLISTSAASATTVKCGEKDWEVHAYNMAEKTVTITYSDGEVEIIGFTVQSDGTYDVTQNKVQGFIFYPNKLRIEFYDIFGLDGYLPCSKL